MAMVVVIGDLIRPPKAVYIVNQLSRYMELINKRFLYFKTYDAFQSRLDAGAIKNDSIVFIDEGDIIWTQGKIFSTSDQDIRDAVGALQENTADIVSNIDNIRNDINSIVSDIDDAKDDITSIEQRIQNIQIGSGGPASNLVTLSASAYQAMVAAGTVDQGTYYFTYEDEDTEWGFGGMFPIIFSDSNSLGTFPIRLT